MTDTLTATSTETETATSTKTATKTSTGTGTGTGEDDEDDDEVVDDDEVTLDPSDPDVEVAEDMQGFSLTGIFRDIKLTGSKFHTVVVNDRDDVRVGGIIYTAGLGDAYLAGFGTDGSLDRVFGSKGRVILNYDGSPDGDDVLLMSSNEDGSLVVNANGSEQRLISLPNDNGEEPQEFGTNDSLYDTEAPVDWLINLDAGRTVHARGLSIQCLTVVAILCPGFGSFGLLTTTTQSVSAVRAQTSGFFLAFATFVQRYDDTGTINTSYGTAGDSAAVPFTISRIALKPGSEVTYVLGRTDDAEDFNRVARYTANGTLDATFGTGGVASLDLNELALDTIVHQSTGHVVLCGTDEPNWTCIRLDSTGARDMAFGTAGTFTTTGLFGNFGQLEDVVRDNQDRIVLVGYTSSPTTPGILRGTVVRTTPNGMLDTH